MRSVLALLALFSGAALLLNILLHIDLRVGLATLGAVVAGAFALMLKRERPAQRALHLRLLAYGAVAGVLGTLAYDVARTILAMIDSSPYRPFEAIMRFGQLLLGTPARDGGVLLAGALFHLLNGTAFGVAFTFAVVRPEVSVRRLALFGMGWGMFLEAFQMGLYPNWLGIQYMREFLTISALGHVAYGATLGPTARWLLRRSAHPGGRSRGTDGRVEAHG